MTTPHVSVCYRPGRFVLPPRYAGKVPAGRLASTPGDNIAEFAGRLAYDSVTSVQGRPTPDYHAHIHETGHNSVYAHAVETFELDSPSPTYSLIHLLALAGRPGVWVTTAGAGRPVRFAVSLRAVLEWAAHGAMVTGTKSAAQAEVIDATNAALGRKAAELLAADYPLTLAPVLATPPTPYWTHLRRVKAGMPQERWISLYMEGLSRDCLQELVRHHYQTNPSVRSTRYCDEGESSQVLHPALAADAELGELVAGHNDAARTLYRHVFRKLAAAGVDRKTARGAARSVLPGATETRLVYSLSEFQARHILALRADQSTGSADPEIVRLAGLVREVLRAEGWAV